MPNKQKKGDDIISLEIDEKTQKKVLKNPKLSKTLAKVFDAVGGIQDKVIEGLKEK